MSARDFSPCWDVSRRREGETAFSAVDAKARPARFNFGRWAIALAAVLFAAGPASPQGLIPVPYVGDDLVPRPDVDVWLRLIRNDKLDLILPSAMREHGIDMWIHVARAGDPDPLAYELGITDGYLIFTDTGDRMERAAFAGVFGGTGAIENIDVMASPELAQAITGYEYGNVDFSVYNEIRDYVAGHNPETIGVNFSEWLAVADGISHTQYLKLERILGSELSSRIVSAEYLITDFRSRRLSLEVAVQAMLLEMARQNAMTGLANIVPGETTIGDVGGHIRIYYSAVSERIREPYATGWISHPQYVLQRGDLFAWNGGADHFLDFGFSSFGVDTKVHAYILREGETGVPESLQRVWDYGKRAQGIIRDNVRVGMTSGEALNGIVAALEQEGYIYTPFPDDPATDYRMIQEYLGDSDTPGFYIDLHAMGNNGGDLVTLGPSIAPFRRDRDPFIMHPNHIFAFEYAVHLNIQERPGYPVTINFSNPQVLTTNGVEWIQDPNYGIYLIH